MRRTLSVCLSVRPVIAHRSFLYFGCSLARRSKVNKGHISYGHLGRTDSCFRRLRPRAGADVVVRRLHDRWRRQRASRRCIYGTSHPARLAIRRIWTARRGPSANTPSRGRHRRAPCRWLRLTCTHARLVIRGRTPV